MSFPVVFGSFLVEFLPKIKFSEHFHSTKRFIFEFQGESLELFLSSLAHFRRYHHLRGYWIILPARTVTVKHLKLWPFYRLKSYSRLLKYSFKLTNENMEEHTI